MPSAAPAAARGSVRQTPPGGGAAVFSMCGVPVAGVGHAGRGAHQAVTGRPVRRRGDRLREAPAGGRTSHGASRDDADTYRQYSETFRQLSANATVEAGDWSMPREAFRNIDAVRAQLHAGPLSRAESHRRKAIALTLAH